MTTILTTTGISLYSNTKRKENTERKEKEKEPTDAQMRQYLRTNPTLASSESNSLLRMATKDDHLVLLHTRTQQAIKCVELLRNYFQNEGYKHVRLVPLEFQDDPKHIETTGLRNLINTLIKEIRTAKKAPSEAQRDVVINATAGFKAQVVYSTMIGMIYRVPIKYIYEDFKSVVTFNPIAVDWDTSLFLNHEDFFRWIKAQSRTYKEVQQYLRNRDDHQRIEALLTPPDADNHVFLSYMGEVLDCQLQDEREEAALIKSLPSAGVKNISDKIATSIQNKNHHLPKGSVEACYKVASLDYVREITGGFFEPTTRTDVKLASLASPNGDILLLWADNEKAARFTISTTARGRPETLKARQEIKELLEIK